MKNRILKEWIWPPADQWIGVWGLVTLAVVGVLVTRVLDFFERLSGMPWILGFFISIGVSALGISLIFYAKFPLYRERRFFTFGPRAVREQRRPFYRWGYACAFLGALLLACLLLSKN
jgi:hypothetical protein